MITNQKYNFKFNPDFYKIFIVCIVLCFGAFLVTFVENDYLKYGLMVVLIISSCIFTIVKLNQKTDLIRVIKQKFNSHNK